MGEFSPPPPPFSEPHSLFFTSYPSNIEIIFDFSEIITKIHPPFQNPGSALGIETRLVCWPPDQVVLVQALVRDIVLCSWSRHFT